MTRDEKILVTGATGLLGAHIVRLLFLRGYTNIHALRRKTSRMDLVSDVKKHITWLEADITDPESLCGVFEDVTCVIHSAALIAFGKGSREKLRSVNVQGTANVVNACLQHGVERLIHMSSIAAFTRTGKKQWIDESTPWAETRYTSHYGRTKYDSELEVYRGMAEGLAVQIINPAIVLGAGFWPEGSLEMFDRAARGLHVYPSGSMGFVDVRDVALLAIKLFETDQFLGQKVIASGHNRTYHEVFSEIGRHFGHGPPAVELKPALGEVAWRFLALFAFVFNRKPLLSRQTVRTTACRISYDNSRSLRVKGFSYTPLEDSLADIAAIYRRSAARNYEAIPMQFRSHHLD